MNMSEVYEWCSKLEEVRTELKRKGATERVTTVPLTDVAAFLAACEKCGAHCTKLGAEQVKVSHHGGSYHKDVEKVRIKFQ